MLDMLDMLTDHALRALLQFPVMGIVLKDSRKSRLLFATSWLQKTLNNVTTDRSPPQSTKYFTKYDQYDAPVIFARRSA